MRLLTFSGGVHPPEKKELAEDIRIRRIELPDYVYLFLSQHTGTPSKPIIEKKDEVEIGMKIAEAGEKLSVPLHSSVNGVFMGVESYPHPLGGNGSAMKIKVDKEKSMEWEGEERNPKDLDREEIISIVKDCGIVGMGGAAFPTYFKLQPPPDKNIKDLIINGAECEPFLTSDYRLMLEKADYILRGTDIIRKIIKPDNVWIAIESNKMEAVEKMREVAADYSGVKVVTLKTKYPQGSERQLIEAVTGRQVPEGGLPFDAGAYVQNVGTAMSVYEAVRYSKPLFERVVTVTGSIRSPGNFLVPIGTPFEHLIEQAGGVMGDIRRIINGGPMMGIAQVSSESPVIKGTTGIVIQNKQSVIDVEEGPCIRCSSCVDICPMGLMPTRLNVLVDKEDFDRAEDMGIMSCMECGSCSYICPARIPLTQQIKYGKNEIMKRRE